MNTMQSRSFFPVVRLLGGILAMVVLGPDWAFGQAPPQISFILPAGGQRGTTVDVTVRGRALMGATSVYLSGQGLTGVLQSSSRPAPDRRQPARLDVSSNPDMAHLIVTIAPDAELGEHDLRILSPGGVSNRFRFFVGQVPEVCEAEPNSTIQEAQLLPSLPIVVNGQSFQGDRDLFRFEARAGETLVLDLLGQRIVPYIADGVPGWYQASLTLYDDKGRELAYVDDFRHHPDPTMVFKVPKDGEYMVEVKDVLYRGRNDFVYRLSIGALPLLTHIFPLGGQRNTTVPVKLSGVNLGGDRLELKLAADSPARQWVHATDPQGIASNTKPFAVGDWPEAIETEPNNTLETAMKVETPLTVNGRIGSPGDVDYFAITVKAKEVLAMEVFARRLDSPLDSLLTLYNAKGRQIQENDDTIDRGEGLVSHHADALLTYTFPTAGTYYLRIADTQSKGGDEYAYRLAIGPPPPDYTLRIRPDNPRTQQGGNVMFTVVAFRKHGFSEEIKLTVSGLPDKFTTPPETIAKGQGEARMIISAPPDAPIGIFTPKITGVARRGDKEVVREAEASEDLMQAFYYMHSIPTKGLMLAVIERGPFTFTLDLPPREVLKVPRSGKVEIKVKAAFREGVKPGEITLRPDRVPREWKIDIPPIPAGEAETTIEITVSGNMAVFVGQRGTLIVTAIMKINNTTLYGFVPAIPYEVVP